MCIKLAVLICFGWECHSHVIFKRKGPLQIRGLFKKKTQKTPFTAAHVEVAFPVRGDTRANLGKRVPGYCRQLTSGSGLQLFHPGGDQDPALPSSPDKAALSPAETSGEQKQERIREDGGTNMALSGFGSRFYGLGLSGNIWLAGRVSILPRLIGRAVNVSVFTSPATLCHEFV